MTNQPNVIYAPYKKVIDVAISKVLMTIFNIFGFGAYFSALYLAWINVDVFTRTVLAFVGLIVAIVKVVIMIDNWWHKRAMNKIERRQKDLEQTIREEKYIQRHRF